MNGPTSARLRPSFVHAFPNPNALERLEPRRLLSADGAEPPQVLSAEFEFQTSHSVVIQFDKNVGASLDRDDFAIVHIESGEAIFGPDIEVAFNGQTNTATFTFKKFKDGLLADGNYRAMLFGAGVSGPDGVPMAADYVFKFRFIRGDANGDGIVNLDDFNALAANFGNTNATFGQGDFNYDGKVDLTDFNILAARFGTSIL